MLTDAIFFSYFKQNREVLMEKNLQTLVSLFFESYNSLQMSSGVSSVNEQSDV